MTPSAGRIRMGTSGRRCVKVGHAERCRGVVIGGRNLSTTAAAAAAATTAAAATRRNHDERRRRLGSGPRSGRRMHSHRRRVMVRERVRIIGRVRMRSCLVIGRHTRHPLRGETHVLGQEMRRIRHRMGRRRRRSNCLLLRRRSGCCCSHFAGGRTRFRP